MKRKGVSYAKWGYIFSAPFAIGFLLFMLYPIVNTFLMGFTDMVGVAKLTEPMHVNPAGIFKVYNDLLHNKTFGKSIVTTFILWILNFIPQITVALVLAAWFTNDRLKIKGKGFFKVVFYLPNIITAASVAVLYSSFFQYSKEVMGPANELFMKLGLIDQPMDFFVNRGATRWIVIFIQFWMWYGYTMIVLISGILGISPELFEAADIDGANGFQKFLYVTIPSIKTILLYTFITSLIGGLQMYDIPYLLTQGNGEPDGAIRTTSVFIFKQAFGNVPSYNVAAAASMIMFIIIGILSAIVFFLMRDKDEAELHKLIKKQEKAYKAKLKAEKAQGGK